MLQNVLFEDFSKRFKKLYKLKEVLFEHTAVNIFLYRKPPTLFPKLSLTPHRI